MTTTPEQAPIKGAVIHHARNGSFAKPGEEHPKPSVELRRLEADAYANSQRHLRMGIGDWIRLTNYVWGEALRTGSFTSVLNWDGTWRTEARRPENRWSRLNPLAWLGKSLLRFSGEREYFRGASHYIAETLPIDDAVKTTLRELTGGQEIQVTTKNLDGRTIEAGTIPAFCGLRAGDVYLVDVDPNLDLSTVAWQIRVFDELLQPHGVKARTFEMKQTARSEDINFFPIAIPDDDNVAIPSVIAGKQYLFMVTRKQCEQIADRDFSKARKPARRQPSSPPTPPTPPATPSMTETSAPPDDGEPFIKKSKELHPNQQVVRYYGQGKGRGGDYIISDNLDDIIDGAQYVELNAPQNLITNPQGEGAISASLVHSLLNRVITDQTGAAEAARILEFFAGMDFEGLLKYYGSGGNIEIDGIIRAVWLDPNNYEGGSTAEQLNSGREALADDISHSVGSYRDFGTMSDYPSTLEEEVQNCVKASQWGVKKDVLAGDFSLTIERKRKLTRTN
jgi:hypothetical protein